MLQVDSGIQTLTEKTGVTAVVRFWLHVKLLKMTPPWLLPDIRPVAGFVNGVGVSQGKLSRAPKSNLASAALLVGAATHGVTGPGSKCLDTGEAWLECIVVPAWEDRQLTRWFNARAESDV
jgi:hypothetical protein